MNFSIGRIPLCCRHAQAQDGIRHAISATCGVVLLAQCGPVHGLAMWSSSFTSLEAGATKRRAATNLQTSPKHKSLSLYTCD